MESRLFKTIVLHITMWLFALAVLTMACFSVVKDITYTKTSNQSFLESQIQETEFFEEEEINTKIPQTPEENDFEKSIQETQNFEPQTPNDSLKPVDGFDNLNNNDVDNHNHQDCDHEHENELQNCVEPVFDEEKSVKNEPYDPNTMTNAVLNLNSGTTYYVNSGTYYTRSSQLYYKCSYCNVNTFTSSSPSGTCYSHPTSWRCSQCGTTRSYSFTCNHRVDKCTNCNGQGGWQDSYWVDGHWSYHYVSWGHYDDVNKVWVDESHWEDVWVDGYWEDEWVSCSTCQGYGKINKDYVSINGYGGHSCSFDHYIYTNIDNTSSTVNTSTNYSTATGFTVHFNNNISTATGSGTLSGSTADQYFLHGHTQNLRINGFSYTNHTFLGWATSASSTTVSYSDGASFSLTTSSVSSGGTYNLYAVWRIDTIGVAKPTLSTSSFVYSGSAINLISQNAISGYDSSLMNISGYEQTTVGTYSVVFSLKNTTLYAWSDDYSTGSVSRSWSITPAPVAKPTLTTSEFPHTGVAINLLTQNAISGYDSSLMNISGHEQTNVGTYTVTFSLKNTTLYAWSDDCSTTSYSITWQIKPNYDVVYNFNAPRTFTSAERHDTGVLLNYSKNFKLDMVVRVPSTSTRWLLLGNYSSDPFFNLEINSGGTFAVYYNNQSSAVSSSTAIVPNEDVTIHFEYVASTGAWSYTASGASTNASGSGTCSTVAGKTATRTLCFGGIDWGPTRFGSGITVKSLSISIARAFNETFVSPVSSTPTRIGYTFAGWNYDLPDGYTKVEYIQSSGQQYIDTGVRVTSDIRAEFKFALNATTSAESYVIGVDIPPYVEFGTISGRFRAGIGNGGSGFVTWDQDTKTHEVSFSSKELVVDGTTMLTGNNTFSLGYNFYMFASRVGGGANYYSSCKVWYCLIFDGDTLIRYYLPVKDSNDVYGLFDLIEQEFYPSATSTPFSGWGYTIPEGYTQVAYIEGNGTQYIDTGYTNAKTDNITIIQDFQMTSTGYQWAGANGYTQYCYAYFDYANRCIMTIDYNGTTFIESCYRNGTLTAQNNWTSYDRNPLKIGIFILGEEGQMHSGTGVQSGKLYSYMLYKNGILVRYYVPVKNSSGVYGLFDVIDQQFFPSETATQFSGGSAGLEVGSTVSQPHDYKFKAQWIANNLAFENESVSTSFSASAQNAAISPATNGTGSYTYAITAGNGNSYFSISGATLTIKASTPVNTYSLTIRATDNETSKTKSKTFTLTINKANITPSVSMNGYAYGGTKQSPSIAGNTGNGSVTYYYNTTNSTSNGTAWTSVTSATSLPAGTYYMYAVVGATTNYNGATSGTKQFVISKGTFTPTVSMSGYTYAGTKSTPSISGNTSGGSVTYYYNTTNSNNGGTAWTSVTSATSLNAGTYYMYAVVGETSNYQSVKSSAVAFTIAKAKVAIPTVSANLTFNTTTQAPTITRDQTLTSIKSGSVLSAVHAKTYNITIEIADKTNYEFTDGTQSKDFTWQIKPFDISGANIQIGTA